MTDALLALIAVALVALVLVVDGWYEDRKPRVFDWWRECPDLRPAPGEHHVRIVYPRSWE